MRRFEGKRAVVTGGASGIGRATALRLVAEGAEVLIGDIDDEGATALVAEGQGAIDYQRCDVMQPGDIAALMATAEAGGGIDALFNNAGAGGALTRIDEIDVAGWDATQNLLLRSVALGIREVAPLMAKRGGGAIVNTASIAAQMAGAAPTPYSVAKAGVLHLSRLAAADLARHRIRVNAVCPGFITTNIFASGFGMTGEKRDQANQIIAQMASNAQPVARAGRPEDIAAAVAFLLSEDAAFVTGTHILVDGGMTVGMRHSWDPDSPGLFDSLSAFAA